MNKNLRLRCLKLHKSLFNLNNIQIVNIKINPVHLLHRLLIIQSNCGPLLCHSTSYRLSSLMPQYILKLNSRYIVYVYEKCLVGYNDVINANFRCASLTKAIYLLIIISFSNLHNVTHQLSLKCKILLREKRCICTRIFKLITTICPIALVENTHKFIRHTSMK